MIWEFFGIDINEKLVSIFWVLLAVGGYFVYEKAEGYLQMGKGNHRGLLRLEDKIMNGSGQGALCTPSVYSRSKIFSEQSKQIKITEIQHG